MSKAAATAAVAKTVEAPVVNDGGQKIPAKIVRMAHKALELDKQIKKLEKELEALKKSLKSEANGNTLTIPILGKGTVIVSKPKDGGELVGEIKTTEFNEDKFMELPQEIKHILYEDGVVVHTTIKQYSSSVPAKVFIKHNV